MNIFSTTELLIFMITFTRMSCIAIYVSITFSRSVRISSGNRFSLQSLFYLIFDRILFSLCWFFKIRSFISTFVAAIYKISVFLWYIPMWFRIFIVFLDNVALSYHKDNVSTFCYILGARTSNQWWFITSGYT